MRMGWLLILNIGCIPSFDSVECYSNLDCPATHTCAANACIDLTDADAGSIEDATSDDDANTDADQADALPEQEDAETHDGDAADVSSTDRGIDAGYSIQTSPALIDFGSRPVHCPGPDELATITNLGVTPVMITGLSFAGGTSPAFTIGDVRLPFLLNPAASRSVPLSFLPESLGVHNGRLLVTYQTEPIPNTSNLTGRGVGNTMVTDSFTQGGGPIDILFVIDNNPSMLQLEQQVGAHVPPLIAILESENWDYQIGVTTGDLHPMGTRGRLIGTPLYITRANTADPQAELETRVLVGESGNPGNGGLEASRLALSPPLTTGTNIGFLRTDAALLVVYVGKDNDTSTSTVSDHAAFLEGLKGVPAAAQANAIVPTSACTLDDGASTTIGTRQIQVAQMTGGVVSDACLMDLDLAMTTLPVLPLETTFPLGFMPQDPTAIEVRVEGNVVPSGSGTNWTYDRAANAIVFSPGEEPLLGDQIEIIYAAGC